MQLNWLGGFLYHTHPRKLTLDIKNQKKVGLENVSSFKDCYFAVSIGQISLVSSRLF